jgi:hypothetical protein
MATFDVHISMPATDARKMGELLGKVEDWRFE